MVDEKTLLQHMLMDLTWYWVLPNINNIRFSPTLAS